MATTYLHALRLFSRDVRLYLIASVLFGFAVFAGIYPVLLNLYLLRLGYGPEFIGLINGAGLLAFALFCLPAGALGGRWGIRRMMIAGLSLVMAGLGLLPLAEFIPADLQAGWLLATYVLSELGFALYMVNADPFLMVVTSPEERNHVFSARAALSTLAGFAGSLLGGLLPGLFAATLRVSLDYPAPYRYPLLIAVVLCTPAVLAILATREVGAGQTQKIVAEGGTPPFGLIALLASVTLIRWAGLGAATTFFNVYLDTGLHVPTAQIGALTAAGQLVSALAALATPLLVARWGNGRTYVFGSLSMALSLLPLALIPHWSAAGLGYVGMIALFSITSPSFTVFQMEIVSPRWRAAMSGALKVAMGLGVSAIALGGGYLITALGYRTLFLTGACLTAAGALLFWAYFRLPRGELARSEIAVQ